MIRSIQSLSDPGLNLSTASTTTPNPSGEGSTFELFCVLPVALHRVGMEEKENLKPNQTNPKSGQERKQGQTIWMYRKVGLQSRFLKGDFLTRCLWLVATRASAGSPGSAPTFICSHTHAFSKCLLGMAMCQRGIQHGTKQMGSLFSHSGVSGDPQMSSSLGQGSSGGLVSVGVGGVSTQALATSRPPPPQLWADDLQEPWNSVTYWSASLLLAAKGPRRIRVSVSPALPARQDHALPLK